ncbi:MAG: cell division protein FtsZ [Candidatus Cloacimonetes bacterium]|nr:cell division protein FtsZ [Candidatus Cloacimonadota bacterium]
MRIEPVLNEKYVNSQIKIKILGVGGAGGNTINTLVEKKLQGVEFVAANTDWGDLQKSKADKILQLGELTSRGHGAGADREIGKLAAEESEKEIIDIFHDADMVFLVAGMGKGTGTGSSPSIVKTIKSINNESGNPKLVVAIVFFPFQYEGAKRIQNAEKGLDELVGLVDTLIVIPNEKIHEEYKGSSIIEAFKKADDIIYHAASAITDLLLKKGYLEVDFRDILTILANKGFAYITSGEAEGDNRALEAAERAMNNPLLSDIELNGTKGLLINITSGPDLGLNEFYDALTKITDTTGKEGDIIHGYVIDNDMNNKVRVTMIATGLQIKSQSYYKVPAPAKSNTHSDLKYNSPRNDWRKIDNDDDLDIDKNSYQSQRIEIEDDNDANEVNNDIPAFYKKFNND